MILYLSGPITNDRDFYKKFEQAQSELMKKGFDDIINPAIMNRVLHKNASWEDYMNIDIDLLQMADVMVQLPGWEKSLGCNREYGYALGADKNVLTLEELLSGSN